MGFFRILNWYRIIMNAVVNMLCRAVATLNSRTYWDSRFSLNWEARDGRLQTALFATAFVLLDEEFAPRSILDLGCACGDSLPVLKMKYPDAELYFYDISSVAMQKALLHYKLIAAPLKEPLAGHFDLIYCSNVIEHVTDFSRFSNDLVKFSAVNLVIQAPFNERHPDGTPLSTERSVDEHVNTITADLVHRLPGDYSWRVKFCQVPFAWPHGEQIIFIGTRKQ